MRGETIVAAIRLRDRERDLFMQFGAELAAAERAGKAEIGAKHAGVGRHDPHHVRRNAELLLDAVQQGLGFRFGEYGVDRGQEGHGYVLHAGRVCPAYGEQSTMLL